jgi:hypothetical protein
MLISPNPTVAGEFGDGTMSERTVRPCRARTRARLVAVAALAATLMAAGCGAPDKTRQAVETSLIQPNCYTVDPFQKLKIAKAPKGLPDQMRAFLGAWGGGAWDGAVCHDLYVLKVEPSGAAVMFDAHGPGYTNDATAFTRRGQIGDDGRLRVRKGKAQVEYWVENGQLHGLRRLGTREARIILTPRT